MTGTAPTVAISVTPTGTVAPGTQLVATLTATDPDTITETLPAGPDSLGRADTVTIARVDPERIAWALDGVQISAGPNTLTFPAPAASAALTATVTDGQGNVVTATYAVTVQAPRPPVLIGVALAPYPNSGHTLQQEYDAYVKGCGQPDLFRVYLTPAQSTLTTLPTSWPIPGEVSDWASRGTLLSLRPDCAAFAAGKYDAKVLALVDAYRGKRLRLALWHEIDAKVKDGTVNLGDWKAAVAHGVALLAGRPLELWNILTGYTWDPASGRNGDDYIVPGVAGYAVDQYNDPSQRHDGSAWKSAAQIMGGFVAWADRHGFRKGWTEIGSAADFVDPAHRAAWIADAGRYGEANDIEIMSWFDGEGPKGDWALRAVIKRGAYFPAAIGAVTSVVPDLTSAAAWKAIRVGQ